MALILISADAKALATIQHAGKRDKGGHAHMDHVARAADGAERRAQAALARGVAVDVDRTVQGAWLHDVVEDTSVTMVDLLTKPVGPR